MGSLREPMMDAAAVEALLAVQFPQLARDGRSFSIEEIGVMSARMRLHVDERHLRPGGTVSGPSIFALADLALYVAVLGQIGPQTLAVTTNITLNFLRKPPPRDLVATCRLLKLGRLLAVGDVLIVSDGDPEPVAHATGTYAVPPRPSDAVS